MRVSKERDGVTHIGTKRIIIPCPPKAPSQLDDPSTTLVDLHDIASQNLFFAELVDHLLSQVINGLHIGRLERQSSGLGRTRHAPIDLHFNHFTFDELGFFADSDAHGTAEGLREGFRFGHLR